MVRIISPKQIVAYIVVGLGAIIMLAPFFFMFVFATHSRDQIFTIPPPLWFGGDLPNNFTILLERIPFWNNIGMSVYVAIMATFLTLFFCSLGGFAFAMYEFRFKKPIFAFIVATILIPPFLGMIPTALVMEALGWMNQPRALYIPGAAGAVGIFIMRQYISSAIPRELVEAARIDGCSEFRIYWNIVLPLIGPALGTLGLLTFIGSWNNYMGPLIVMQIKESYTLPLALNSLNSPINTEHGAMMAGAAIATIPMLVVFAMSTRRMIEGLTAGAVRG